MRRSQKVIRNLALCTFLGILVHALLGFPPYTTGEMCRQMQRSLLLPELEPLYVRHEFHNYYGDWVNRRYSFILGRSGNLYVSFLYDRNLLQNNLDYGSMPKLGQDALCTAWNGYIYAAEPFEDAASAVLTVEAELRQDGETLKSKTFTIEGERLKDEVFGFPYSQEHGSWYWSHRDSPDLPEALEENLSLYDVSDTWYRTSKDMNGGYGILHADLPCTLILYDKDGAKQGRWELSIDNYEIFMV